MEVAVTGLGVAGAGLSEPEDLWRRMGARGADGTPAAHEPYDPTPELGRGMRYKDRATKLALLAADRALRSAGGGEDRPGRAETTAVVASSNFGNLDTVCEAASVIARSSVSETSAMELPNASSNVIGSSIAIRHGLRGPNVMLCNGAASGLDAVHLARTLLAAGRADRVLVVGTEAAGAAVARWHGLSTQELFDGAAALVLEDAAAAAADGRPVRVLVDAFSRRLGARASASAALAGGAAKPSLWLTGACPDPEETREDPDPAPAWGLPPWRDLEAVFGPAFGALGVLQAVAAAHRIAGHGDPAVLVTAGGGTAEAAASLLLTSAGPA